jgi:hypothetical protein
VQVQLHHDFLHQRIESIYMRNKIETLDSVLRREVELEQGRKNR